MRTTDGQLAVAFANACQRVVTASTLFYAILFPNISANLRRRRGMKSRGNSYEI
jgi:hypothetical protein